MASPFSGESQAIKEIVVQKPNRYNQRKAS